MTEFERLCGQATEALERAERAAGTDAVRDVLLHLARTWKKEPGGAQAHPPEVRMAQLTARMNRLVDEGDRR